MLYYCTYLDSNYLARGLLLYRSLLIYSPKFTLFILCLNERAKLTLDKLKLRGVIVISLADFEKGDTALLKAKQNRSLIEYYFSSTSSLLLYVLNMHPEVDLITYLDADMYFFSDIGPVFKEIAGHSIAIVEHRFSPNIRERVKYGKYNVGWLSFRRDSNGLACLHWWRARCLEWCYDRLEDGKFADQKYLDVWPERFLNLIVLHNKGLNVAPWNLANYKFTYRDRKVWVDEQPLILFHFHGIKKVIGPIYDTGLDAYKVKLENTLREYVFKPYLTALASVHMDLSEVLGCASLNSIRLIKEHSLPQRIWGKFQYIKYVISKILVPVNCVNVRKTRTGCNSHRI